MERIFLCVGCIKIHGKGFFLYVGCIKIHGKIFVCRMEPWPCAVGAELPPPGLAACGFHMETPEQAAGQGPSVCVCWGMGHSPPSQQGH